MKDEILTELWSIKDQIAAETKGSTRALFERLKVIQNKSGRPIINRTQKRKMQAT
jgi:hypothetical protein